MNAVDRLLVKLAQVSVKGHVRKDEGGYTRVSPYVRKGIEALIQKTGPGAPRVMAPAPQPKPGSPGRRVVPHTFTEEQKARAQEVESKVKAALDAGKETIHEHAVQVGTDKEGDPIFKWSPTRVRQHKEIIEHFWDQEFADVPSDGKAVVSGGIGGAGKSTILKSHASIERDQYGTVNPDDIKEYMAEQGLIPEIEGLDPMEASALVHEESSYLAKMLAQRAYNEKKNLIWDITMSSARSIEQRVDDMRKYGYRDIHGVFVDIPVEISVHRAINRWWGGHQAGGIGGRYVPPALIRRQASEGGHTTLNRRVFEEHKPRFTSWEMWNTSGAKPKKIGSSETRT